MQALTPVRRQLRANARHVELDSDHYVTLREPELVSRTLSDFLTPLAPADVRFGHQPGV